MRRVLSKDTFTVFSRDSELGQYFTEKISYGSNRIEFQKVDLLNSFFENILALQQKENDEANKIQIENKNIEDIYCVFFTDAWLLINQAFSKIKLPDDVNLHILGICPMKSYEKMNFTIEKYMLNQLKGRLLDTYQNLSINDPQIDMTLIDLYNVQGVEELLYMKKSDDLILQKINKNNGESEIQENQPQYEQNWLQKCKNMYWLHSLKPFGLFSEKLMISQIVQQLENKFGNENNQVHFVLNDYSPIFQSLKNEPGVNILKYMMEEKKESE